MEESGIASRMNTVYRWGVKGGLSILDQGLFSGANFVLSVILARWLSAEQFGAYAIGFTFLMFIYQFYISYLLDPMGVLGPSYYSDTLQEYLLAQLKCHFAITIATGVIFIIVGIAWMNDQDLVRETIISMGGGLSLALLPWYFRRVFYVLGQPSIAMWGSVVYAIILVGVTVLMREVGILSSSFAMAAMAVSGLLSGLFFLFIFRSSKLRRSAISFTGVLTQNWRFGKWLILSGVFIAFASQAQIWISARFLDLSASGAIRALQVITQPMMLAISALTALATPSLSFEFSRGNIERFNRKIFLLSVTLLVLAIVFELALLVYNAPLGNFIYAGKFSADYSILPIWGLIPILLAYSSGLQAGFQAAQRPYALLIAAILWAAVSFGFGVWFTLRLGILGAAWSAVFGYLAFVLVLSILYWLWVYQPLVSKRIEP